MMKNERSLNVAVFFALCAAALAVAGCDDSSFDAEYNVPYASVQPASNVYPGVNIGNYQNPANVSYEETRRQAEINRLLDRAQILNDQILMAQTTANYTEDYSHVQRLEEEQRKINERLNQLIFGY